jgi:hypothetical protein
MSASETDGKDRNPEVTPAIAPSVSISDNPDNLHGDPGFWQYLTWGRTLTFIATVILSCIIINLFAGVVHARKQQGILKELGIQISDDDEDKDLKSALADALLLLKGKEYPQARARFVELLSKARTDHMRTIIDGLVSATYDGSGQHRAGIDYLCKAYQGKPQEDVRYRFNFAVHLREIAEREGMNTAEELISTLRPTCKRSDLSYVWIGIPRVKSENLRNGMTL